MNQYFVTLFRYNAWANERIINCLVQQSVSHERILTLMGHIIAAQFVWLHRVKGLPPPDLKLWGTYTLDELPGLASKASNQWLDFIETSDDSNREVSYHNLAGQPYTSHLEVIMMQVANHSTYHRGQISVLLRDNGFEPVNTDFIIYDRMLKEES